jgi:heat shock protein HtpX
MKAGITTMPEVGIYESPEVNAFATGPTRNRALVAVSRGLLERMDNPSLEGVLAHEIAHVANGDMVTMTLVQGVVNAFVMFFARVIGFAIGQAMRGDNEERRSGGGFVEMMIVMVLQILFGILGSTVVAAFSRWREFRADAAGAQLAGSAKMIGALTALRNTFEMAEDPNGPSTSIAAFKISSKPSGIRALFSTHPPLEDRIARLQQAGRMI